VGENYEGATRRCPFYAVLRLIRRSSLVGENQRIALLPVWIHYRNG